jgi:subtilase family serine protease
MKLRVPAATFGAALLALSACSSSGSVAPQSLPLNPAPSTTSIFAAGAGYGTFSLGPNLRRACEPSADPSQAHCLVLVHTDRPATTRLVSGVVPSEIQSAYNLPSSTAGSGQTVAVVDAFDDPNAEADLGAYRAEFGLPACSSSNGCFQKLNEQGVAGSYPAANSGWAVEESLDVDMVSAVCPNCHIILMEASSSSFDDLGATVDEAVKLGAVIVSNSYIGYGATSDKPAKYYNHSGVIITAGAGDEGFGTGEPAGFPTVVSVGGTVLTKGGGSRGYSETAWSGTGSGCMTKQSKPSWQTDKRCKWRTMNDVAAFATDAAIYDTYPSGGWFTVDGTSIATPVIAGVYALAGNANTLDAAQSLYAKGASLFDITSGSNGSCRRKLEYQCTAGPGYDGPTGKGTPNGVSAF